MMNDHIKIKQPQGNAKANFKNIQPSDPRYAQMDANGRYKNDRMPTLEGTISKPENPDELYRFVAWKYEDTAKNTTFLMGTVEPLPIRAGMEDRMKTKIDFEKDARHNPETGEIDPYQLSPYTVVLRENPDRISKQDTACTDLTEDELAKNARRQYLWGKWQHHATDEEVRIALWDRSGKYGAFLSGNTQNPLTKEEVAALQQSANVMAKPLPAKTPAKKTRASSTPTLKGAGVTRDV